MYSIENPEYLIIDIDFDTKVALMIERKHNNLKARMSLRLAGRYKQPNKTS